MSIELQHLTKNYGSVPIVDGVSLSIASGELFVLLGPSGSGKSTLLRMIAGLAEVDSGRISLHGLDVTGVSPKDRGIGFVFQHYALFRHMTVAANVEFALRIRRVPAAQRRERREELLQMVGLSGYAERYPRQLSGGQQQRVALARALAHRPKVLLLDEPFGALDAKIRLELRQALRQIQRELAITTVFVTHDQEEAFGLGDRLAVLSRGRLLEVGEPQELYLRPRSPFVATFLGAANLLVGESGSKSVRLGPVELPISGEWLPEPSPGRVQVLFRPEDVEVGAGLESAHPILGRGVVEQQAFVGSFERLRLRLPSLEGVRVVAPKPPFGQGDSLWIDALRPQHEAVRHPLQAGGEVTVAIRRFHLLAPASLRLLVDATDSAVAEAARALAKQLSSRVAAHVEPLDHETTTATDPEDLGAETESGAEGFDIAVLALEPQRLGMRLQGLEQTRHHLLLVPGPAVVPTRLLVCVAVGEPGKADVRFAERFAWQLGASATVATVLPEEEEPVPVHVERFLEACQQTLGARGVVTKTRILRGPVLRKIREELAQGGYDLLVVGAPLPGLSRDFSRGFLESLLHEPPGCPILVVRGQVVTVPKGDLA